MVNTAKLFTPLINPENLLSLKSSFEKKLKKKQKTKHILQWRNNSNCFSKIDPEDYKLYHRCFKLLPGVLKQAAITQPNTA